MLTVYRASAGAGKTHKLTGEYLKLLFASPGAYRHILAVTFTNKATDEMKSRIVEELFILSSGRKSDYVSSLSDQFKLDEAQVRAQAKRILIAILHDYSAFNISTIDRFFQQTMRAFTREIGLQGGYGIEMDQELVLTEAIDNLLSGLEKPESKELLGWLLRFAADKVEAGGEWNLRRDIAALSREVFKESYKAFSADVAKDIEDKTALESYKNQLFAIIRSVESEARDLGREGMAVLDQYALQTSDFKGGSRSPLNFFTKLIDGEMKEPSNTFVGLADNLEGCFTAKTDNGLRQVIGCAFEDETIRSRIQRFPHIAFLVMHCQDDHFNLRMRFFDPPCRMQTVFSRRHTDVHQYKIRLRIFQLHENFIAISGISDDLHVRLRIQHEGQRVAHQCMIVCYYDFHDIPSL